MFPDLSKLNEDQVFEFSSNLTKIIANKLSEAMKKVLPLECQDTAAILCEAFFDYEQDISVEMAFEKPIKENSLEAFLKVCPSLTLEDIIFAHKETIKAIPFEIKKTTIKAIPFEIKKTKKKKKKK